MCCERCVSVRCAACALSAAVAASLIFTNRYYIRRVALSGGATALLAHNLSNAVALDAWTRGRCLYWSDVTRLGSAIRRDCRPAPAPAAPPAPPAPPAPAHYQASTAQPTSLAIERKDRVFD